MGPCMAGADGACGQEPWEEWPEGRLGAGEGDGIELEAQAPLSCLISSAGFIWYARK